MNRFTTGVGLVAKVALVGSSVALLGAACWKEVVTNRNVGPANGNTGANENVNVSEIDSSDWLTYTNEEYGYSVKYPKDWIYFNNIGDQELEYIQEKDPSFIRFTNIKNKKSQNSFVDISIKVELIDATKIPTSKYVEYNGYYFIFNEGTWASDFELQILDSMYESITFSNENNNSLGQINTSDWVLYKSNALGLSFKYQKISGSVTEFQSDCVDDERCFSGSTIGWEFNGEGSLSRQYTLAASVSKDDSVDRETWPTDYSDFYFDSGYHLLGSTEIKDSDKTIEIRIKGNSNGNDYIIYDLTSFSKQADEVLNQAKVAMIKFPVGQNDLYKAFTIYFENPTSVDEIITSIESVQFE